VIFHESLLLENIRYGMWVYVLGIPCHDKWRTEKGLKVASSRIPRIRCGICSSRTINERHIISRASL